MAKTVICSAYNLPKNKKFTNPGTRIRNIYKYDINSRGAKVLKISETEDLQDLINSYEEETKIENIVARAKLGDRSGFKDNINYADMTKVADNLIDAKRQILQMENLYNSLPAEVKTLYGNDIDKFINDAGSKKWKEAMGIKEIKTTPVVDQSKKEEPSNEGE